MGLPQGVDPMAVQQFQGEQQGQQIRGNIDQRAGQDHQSKYDFANKFIGGLPQQSDPTLGAIQQAGGPQGAEALLNILGNQYGRRGELDNRSAINNADNAAAQTRLETEIRLKQEAAVAEQQRQTGVDTGKEERLRQALVKGQTTGDWTDFYSMAPNAVGMPTQYDREQQSQDSAAARAQAEKDKQDQEILRKQLEEQKAKKTKENPNAGKSRLRVGLEHTPIGFMASNNAEGKNNFRNFAEHTPLGLILKWLGTAPEQPDPNDPYSKLTGKTYYSK